MAAYPSLGIDVGAREMEIDPIIISRSRSGTAKARRLQTASKRGFQFTHEILTSAERSTLKSFYNSNREVPFDFTWPGDGQVYSCIFSDPGIVWSPLAGGYWRAEVTLEQV